MDGHLSAKEELRRLLDRRAGSLGLTPRAIEVIVDRATIPPSWRPGGRVCGSDDRGNYLHLLIFGIVKLVCRPAGGAPIVIQFMAPGQFIGAMPCPGRSGYRVEVIAHTEATAAILTHAHMLEAMAGLPTNHVARLASWYCRRSDGLLYDKIVARALPLAARVRHELRGLVRSFGEPIGDGWIIACDLRHRDIAALVGCSRPNVSRVLKALREAGRIDRVGRRFFVSNTLLSPAVARRPPQNPPGVDPFAARSRAGSCTRGREVKGRSQRRGRRS